ncbi:colorectal mutant cancer protein-like isoform X3 [Ptychodera flava]|uniref:colorectal mutant cancer protein-like isoform X3 n=1 Tax=Ptychodera flava TaxID=63121 RepID=UPI00396AA84E
MKELNAVKEEKAEPKAQNYLLEKEKKAIELKLSTREAQEQAYLLHIEHLKSEVKVKEQSQARMKGDTTIEKDGSSPGAMKVTPSMTLAELSNYELGDIESDPNMPQDLAKAHKCEKRLKLRVQELVATLEKLQKNSEELRHQQSAAFVSDLNGQIGISVLSLSSSWTANSLHQSFDDRYDDRTAWYWLISYCYGNLIFSIQLSSH